MIRENKIYSFTPIVKDNSRPAQIIKNFQKVSNSLKTDIIKLFSEKETITWINANQKSKEGNHTNYYAYNRKDYSFLSKLLNEISLKEQELSCKGYNLEGIKSFNRNVWLDLSRESNAIEGIFEDFDVDLRDFRTQLRGKFAISDPDCINFNCYDYFKILNKREKEISKKNDSVVYSVDNDAMSIKGKTKKHKLSISTVRHYIAYKYAYKCAKKEIATNSNLMNEFKDIIHWVASLLSGNDFVSFRYDTARVEGANWAPVKTDEIEYKINALTKFMFDAKQSAHLHPIEKAAIFHAEFIRIHPFADGNGRSTRILTNYFLIREEIPTVSVKCYKDEKQKYFNAINTAIEKHEIDDLIDLFYNEVLNSALKIKECLVAIEKSQKKDIEEENKKIKKINWKNGSFNL